MRSTSTSTCSAQAAITRRPKKRLRALKLGYAVFCGAVFCGALLTGPALAVESLATTPQGVYEGQWVDGVHHFLGIAYAQSTAGENRWQPPKPITAHEGTKQAKTLGPACLQTSSSTNTSEDCLSLNVWTSDLTAAKRPVVVWIHGGGLRAGSNDQQGQVLVNPIGATSPAVVVAINYRLGPLGFFAHRSLKTKHANFGVLDMIAALKWVQDNIEGFGGNPDNVTIAGVSAGGMAVNMLMTSPRSKGLFHKAIAQSGYGTWPLSHTRHAKRQQALGLDGAELLSAERISANLVKTLTPKRQTRSLLYSLDPQELINALQGFQLPYVDGKVLKAEPGIRFTQNKQHKVPFITGGNSNEGSVMGSSGITSDEFASGFGADSKRFKKLYKKDFQRDDRAGWARIFGDTRYVLAAHVQGEAMSRSQRDTWLYYVDFVPEAYKQQWIGTPHGADAWLLFNGHASKDPAIQKFSQLMRAYWLNFAATGNPNGTMTKLPDWPRYTVKGKQWLRLSENPTAERALIADKLKLLTERYRLRTKTR